MGYVSKEDKKGLNEQSTIIDERDEESYEGNAGQGSPFKSKKRIGTETPDSHISGERRFKEQKLNVESNIIIEGEANSPHKSRKSS